MWSLSAKLKFQKQSLSANLNSPPTKWGAAVLAPLGALGSAAHLPVAAGVSDHHPEFGFTNPKSLPVSSANPAEPARQFDPECAKLYRGAGRENRPFVWLFCGFFLPEAVLA